MGFLKSKRFWLGVANTVFLAACEGYEQYSGSKISVEFKGFVTTTILGLIGVDTYRQLGVSSVARVR